MNKIIALSIVACVLVGSAFFFLRNTDSPNPITNTPKPPTETADIPAVTVLMENLEIPWDIAFLPDGKMLVSERPGRLLVVSQNGEPKEITLDGVRHVGEGGLLGVTLHPDFAKNHFVYLYISSGYSKEQTRNRVERYVFANDTLTDKKIILDNIPGAIYHDGGRMEFGPDGMLYIATGDATDSKIAQDKNSLGGKILRLRDDGKVPSDNPFFKEGSPQMSAIWSYGHRNPQGLAFDSAGRLWETEHGRSGITTGLDEINLITKGGNYGWPKVEGDETEPGMIPPALHSGSKVTWAPASLVYIPARNNIPERLFFGGLRGEALYEVLLENGRVKELKTHFKNEFGRIRTVRLGPDGILYITTSNRDSRGSPSDNDDRLIRINPTKLN